MCELSIVIPCYYTDKNIIPLCDALTTELGTQIEYEIILVNDGSKDQTWHYIKQVAEKNVALKGVNFTRNFGQHNALLTGILEANGTYIVTIDDDLQHPPGEILNLLKQIKTTREDLIYAIPIEEKHGVVRDIFSVVAKLIFEKSLKVAHASNTSSFRVFHKILRQAFVNYTGKGVDIDALLLWGTQSVGTVKVKHNDRQYGKSNYNFWKLVSYAAKMIISSSTFPLRMVTYLGFLFTLFGIGIFLYVTFGYLFLGRQVPGFTFLSSLVSLFSGTILFSLGVIGEYLAQMYYRQMGYPFSVVREKVNIDNE